MTFWMFVSSIVLALAWPLTVLAIMGWFRYPLTELLLRLARSGDGSNERRGYPPASGGA